MSKRCASDPTRPIRVLLAAEAKRQLEAAVSSNPVPAFAHSHAPDSLRPRVLMAAGASAGLIPCPSELVVLLGAVAQQQIALGLLLIVVFSLGLASTLTALGLIVVQTRRVGGRWRPTGQTARVVSALPAISAVIIVVVGLALTASAVPKLS